jgi:DNA-binding CsgD family transcriptional regulator
VLLDASGYVIHANPDARQILCYPATRQRVDASDRSLAKSVGRLLASFPDLSSRDEWSTQIASGKRCYRCRAFATTLDRERRIVVLVERQMSKLVSLARLFDEHGLTPRERETAQFLGAGLRNKEIAARMGVSVNTVKAFIRSAMLKVGVSTRAGIIGRLTQMD